MWTLWLAACGGDGTWTVGIWGEEYIEQGIEAEVFADGCSVTFSRFEVAVTEAALLDGDGEVVGSLDPGAFVLTEPGPQPMGAVEVPAGHYDTARFIVGPGVGPAVAVEGELSCGADTVSFAWSFEAETTYLCEPDALTIPAGGEAATELTIHGDHLFYDGLENEDAVVRGQAIVDADADADGIVTEGELAAVPVAPLGYQVGSQPDVTHLQGFVEALTRTVGHVDGEGHCAVAD